MEWNSETVKTLRCRMGWSQSDLARRLQVESQNIFSWEAGMTSPDEKCCEELSLLFRQAEVSALDIISQVQAEVVMDQNALESIDLRDLKFADNRSKLGQLL